jgi:hypothetical protein
VGPFLRVRSAKFTIMPGEDDDLVNEGMYGKSLAIYLQQELTKQGYEVPFYCCEDWGWWVELKGYPYTFGVCIYGQKLESGELDLYVTDGAVSNRVWSWRKFRFLDISETVAKLHHDLVIIFRNDPEVRLLATDLDSPFLDDEP